MNILSSSNGVAAPKHEPRDFLNYEVDCRATFKPLVDDLLDMAEQAGWERRIVASTIMFLAAQNVSAAPKHG